MFILFSTPGYWLGSCWILLDVYQQYDPNPLVMTFTSITVLLSTITGSDIMLLSFVGRITEFRTFHVFRISMECSATIVYSRNIWCDVLQCCKGLFTLEFFQALLFFDLPVFGGYT